MTPWLSRDLSLRRQRVGQPRRKAPALLISDLPIYSDCVIGNPSIGVRVMIIPNYLPYFVFTGTAATLIAILYV